MCREHIKAETRGLFALLSGRSDTANAPCHGGTHIVMRLLTSRRDNLHAVCQEQGKMVNGRLIHDTDALEIEA